MSGGSKTWLEKFLAPGRAERRAVSDFVAYRWTGTTLRKDPIRDISATGVYLVTDEPLHLDTFLSLTMQREGPFETDPDRRMFMQARVARQGEDGVGLAFVMPKDKHSRKWASLVEGLVSQLKPDDLQGFVKVHGGVDFLHRICPMASEEIGQLMQGRLSNHKISNALEIALWADNLVRSNRGSGTMLADPQSVLKIIEVGSSTDELWLQHCWGGLLAAGCSVDGQDGSNGRFVDLFCQMVTFQARILTVVCTRATKVKTDSGKLSAKPIACDLDELVATIGSRGVQIDRDLERLTELGLIEKRNVIDAPTLVRSSQVYIRPSVLGLELHARCNGFRGDPFSFYKVNSRGAA